MIKKLVSNLKINLKKKIYKPRSIILNKKNKKNMNKIFFIK